MRSGRPTRVRHDLPRAPLLLLAHLAPDAPRSAWARRRRRRPFARRTAARSASWRLPIAKPGARTWLRCSSVSSNGGIGDAARFTAFAHATNDLRASIAALVRELVASGERVAGYGAAAKAVVLLHACGLGRAEIDYVARSQPVQAGKAAPGSSDPGAPSRPVTREPSGYVLLFVWNIADEVIEQQSGYLDGGGRFVVPNRGRP